MTIPSILVSNYNYHLPDERIARYPVQKRDTSKLLYCHEGEKTIHQFNKITELLPNNSMLVFNNTKVIRARIHFTKDTGASIEIFCLEPIAPSEVQLAFHQKEQVTWKCIVGNQKRWKSGKLEKTINYNNQSVVITAERVADLQDALAIKFTWDNPLLTFSEIIELIGQTPIPPYLNRKSEEIDTERYQTVYSLHKGSVAAPTAGLHFTPELLREVQSKGIELSYVTLHVGAGTFKPVKAETIDGHEMHQEHFIITTDAINQLLNHNGKTIAVGTTTVRTLESLYWLGVRLNQGKKDLVVGQWDPYEIKTNLTVSDALNEILTYLKQIGKTEITAHTGIMIAPGYEFKIIDGLITNFHQPQSTLLLLIAALIGDEWKEVYQFALNNDFRFLSYGDSSLIMKPKHKAIIVEKG
jgi:S-adenosylmethionine:tRNA ribosyltransferase-isomerase